MSFCANDDVQAYNLERVHRLTDTPDREWFDELLKTLVDEHFRKAWDQVFKCERLIFGDYMGGADAAKSYAEVDDLTKLRTVMEGYLDDFNSATNKPMKLVLFLDAIEHVSRIARILRYTPKSDARRLMRNQSTRMQIPETS